MIPFPFRFRRKRQQVLADAGTRARVVIIGGGFGGLQAAKALAGAPVQVTLVDRRNHHLFQPLLYQVATAALSPEDIAQPIRSVPVSYTQLTLPTTSRV
jgi:NADH dehydrogenase